MGLSQTHCEACNKNTLKLSAEEAARLLAQLSGWAICGDGKWLEKSYKFKKFADALVFVNKAGEVAEAECHHPDIAFGWGYATIRLQTHVIDGLHVNDFIVAAKIDEISG